MVLWLKHVIPLKAEALYTCMHIIIICNYAIALLSYRYVILVIDEVHIKDDLVYDKHSGVLIGFVNMGDINNHLLQYEASLSEDCSTRSLAKSMLVFMIRGLFSNLNFPYAQFACSNLTGDLLFDHFGRPYQDWKDKTYECWLSHLMEHQQTGDYGNCTRKERK